MQFIRYAPLVAAKGANVVMECPAPLTGLVASCAGVSEVVARGAELPPFDLHAPLMNLPGLMATRADTIPADTPYLSAPKRAGAELEKALKQAGRRARKSASPGPAIQRMRTIATAPAAQLVSRAWPKRRMSAC